MSEVFFLLFCDWTRQLFKYWFPLIRADESSLFHFSVLLGYILCAFLSLLQTVSFSSTHVYTRVHAAWSILVPGSVIPLNHQAKKVPSTEMCFPFASFPSFPLLNCGWWLRVFKGEEKSSSSLRWSPVWLGSLWNNLRCSKHLLRNLEF